MAQVIWFIVVAFAFTWALLPAAATSIPISLVALCGPAAAALIVARLSGPGVWSELLARLTAWRVPASLYAIALLAPIAISSLARGIELALGAPASISWIPITPLQAVVFVLVAGEEIGWRGFLTPRLLGMMSPLTASITTGAIWAVWHFPLFHMPSMPQHGSSFPAFVLYTIALSVLLTRLGMRSNFSVLLATLFHGAVNTFGFINDDATALERGWANALAYGSVALVLEGVFGVRPRSDPAVSDRGQTSV